MIDFSKNYYLLHIQELHDMFYDMALLVEEQVSGLAYDATLFLAASTYVGFCSAA